MFQRIRYSIVVFSVIGLCITGANAQKFVLHASAGYATFGLKSLKDQQHEMSTQMPVQGKIVQSFPGYLNYSADFIWQRDSVYFGLMFGHTSTGGRVAYADYSGYSHVDHKLGLTYYGIQAARRIGRGPKTGYFLGIQVLSYIHSLKIHTKEVVFDESWSSTQEYTGGSISLGPFFEVRRQHKKFIFKGRAAYELHIPGAFDAPDDSPMADTQASATGARISLGVGYVLK